jgi:integrase/recombinase XerD
MKRYDSSPSCPNRTTGTKAYLEPSEVVTLEECASNLRDRLLIRLLFHLGCRISEVLALQVQDIDFGRGTVIIQHLKCRVRLSCHMCGARLGMTHVFCPKCGRKIEKSQAEEQQHRRRRILPIDSHSLDLLKEYVERNGLLTRNGKQLIFEINRHRAWWVVKECAERAGLPKLENPETGRVHNVSPHRSRDAFAIHAVKLNDSGDGLKLLQEHLGHQSFNTTAKYRKVAGEEHMRWYEKLWE